MNRGGPDSLVVNIIVKYCCTQRCKKKLKLKKQGYFVAFLSLAAFRLGGPGPLATPKPGSFVKLLRYRHET